MKNLRLNEKEIIILTLSLIPVFIYTVFFMFPKPEKMAPESIQAVESEFVSYASDLTLMSCEKVYFPLTDDERAIVEAVVAAEAIGEPYLGQKAVAQCILESARATNQSPGYIVMAEGQYADPMPIAEISDSVRDAVSAVFDDGDLVTEAPIRYFYAPAMGESDWHESLNFEIAIGGHRFFTEE